jgi:HlyD family type I secretion membrane fusion protein
MPVLGITGGIATGKSSFVEKLRRYLPAELFDADATVHLLLAEDSAVHAALREAFGAEVFAATGLPDRLKLRALVFDDPGRRATLEGQKRVIEEKIHQLRSQIEGAEAQSKAFTAQVESVKREAESVAPLVEKMLLPKPRLLQLQRTAFGLEGQIADAQANIGKFRQAIAEQELQITQLHNDRMAEVTKDLREIQARLLEVIPKRTSAEAVLNRMEIRSPYAGKVVALNVFSLGGVIQRGEKIMDIVPDDDGLTIEAQVAVEEISDVHPGMRADVHLTAFKQRLVPTLRGEVVQVSADRLNDPKTGAPFYIATIKLDAKELAELKGVKLHPGMPATVMLPTDSRTAFDYIVGPLAQSFRHSFKQR